MEIAIIVLGLIILGLLVDRYLFVKQMSTTIEDSMKAIMSRNINEFLSAKAIDKVTEKMEVTIPDEIPVSELNDDQFDEMIKNQTK